MMEQFLINKNSEYINLTQFLKASNMINSGGEVQLFLNSHTIKLNNVIVFEKRKKIYAGDILEINDEKYQFTKDS